MAASSWRRVKPCDLFKLLSLQGKVTIGASLLGHCPVLSVGIVHIFVQRLHLRRLSMIVGHPKRYNERDNLVTTELSPGSRLTFGE